MTSVNKVEVGLVADEDIVTCFQVLSKSFGHDAPFVDVYFPNHDTPIGQAQGSKRLGSWKNDSKDSTFLKAVAHNADEDQEKIIGFAVWTYMKEPPPAELEEVENVKEVWPDHDDREFMTRLWRSYVVPRTQAIEDCGGKGVYVLELLAVHPDYQRLGAGTALVKWGTRAADERDVSAVVEGTRVAQRLYEQCGLQIEIEEMTFDVGEEFSGRRVPKLLFMKRDTMS